MKKFIFLFTFISFCLSAPMNACSCINILSFCEGVNSNSKVVEVEILEKYGTPPSETYMDVKILETLQGDISEDIITIRNYGTTCDISFDRFDIGQKLVVTFSALETTDSLSNYPYFHFAVCTNNFLNLEGDNIIGKIEPSISSKNYTSFKNDLGECSDLTLFDRNPEKLDEYIYLFPNPTFSFLNLNSYTLNPEEISFELFNATGQKITTLNNAFEYNFSIDLSPLPHGVYFLKNHLSQSISCQTSSKNLKRLAYSQGDFKSPCE